jgi:hypothetical protein
MKLDAYSPFQILVTHFPTKSTPQTPTASSAACELVIHLVCGSRKRKLDHVQTCLCTWVCLTQHPSDTLWPFQELNCQTLYTLKSSLSLFREGWGNLQWGKKVNTMFWHLQNIYSICLFNNRSQLSHVKGLQHTVTWDDTSKNWN